MKKIASGLQSEVYDFGNQKVLKKPKKKSKQYLTYLLWDPNLLFSPKKLHNLIKKANEDRSFAMNYFLKNKFQKRHLANAEFVKEGIIQDKVTPLYKLFGTSIENDKILINSYVKLIFLCWREGFADRIYDLDTNFGMNHEGDMVLIDFLEITTTKKEVEKEIKNKQWQKAAFYKFRLNKELIKYYDSKMRRELTIKNLNKYWKKK